jgi:putative hydrolase of the HAD superfamily
MAAELAETFPVLRRQKHIVYPDAIPALERLYRRYSLGLLTNGTPDLQRRKIEGACLAGYFDHTLISGDIGIGKPDRRVFDMILDRMKAKGETTLMIGNSMSSDIRGAQGAGIRAVWINRTGKSRDACIIPDWEISTLDELPPILDGFSY